MYPIESYSAINNIVILQNGVNVFQSSVIVFEGVSRNGGGGGGRRSTAAFERAQPPNGPLTFRDGRHRATEPGRYKSVGFPSPESGPVVRG